MGEDEVEVEIMPVTELVNIDISGCKQNCDILHTVKCHEDPFVTHITIPVYAARVSGWKNQETVCKNVDNFLTQ